MIEINEERLQKVMGLPLLEGGHSPNSKYCVMEAAAYIAGEPWSDAPKCVCPVIRSFMVTWNDSLPTDEDRDRLLKPLLTKVINTNSTAASAEKRSYMAIDWLIRVHTPKFLDLTDSLKGHAKSLRELEEITDLAGLPAAGDITSAADSAARSAARSAAHSALQPTVEWLQASASDLVIRMCEEGHRQHCAWLSAEADELVAAMRAGNPPPGREELRSLAESVTPTPLDVELSPFSEDLPAFLRRQAS